MVDERRLVEHTPIFWAGDESQPLAEFISELLNILQSIPVEHRHTAVAKYESGYYDSGDSFKVVYSVPETDAERAKRQAWEDHYRNEAAERERREFARLKAKFEGS